MNILGFVGLIMVTSPNVPPHPKLTNFPRIEARASPKISIRVLVLLSKMGAANEELVPCGE